jgi:hypothetical protein
LRARGFEPFDFIGWDADELAETEAGELAAMEHLTDFFGAAAPSFGKRLGGERLRWGPADGRVVVYVIWGILLWFRVCGHACAISHALRVV